MRSRRPPSAIGRAEGSRAPWGQRSERHRRRLSIPRPPPPPHPAPPTSGFTPTPRALKLWFVIRNLGVEGLASLIREHTRIARLLSDWIDADAELERRAGVNFSTVAFRHRGSRLPEERLEEHNTRILAAVNATREIYLSHTRVRGSYALRIAIGNIHTTEAYVRRALDLVKEAAKAP